VLLDGQEIGEINLVTHERIERDNFVMVMDLITQALYSTVAQVIYIVLLALVLFYLYYAKVIVPHARKKQQKKRQQDRRR
jgi:Ca2+/Na+ antiporter